MWFICNFLHNRVAVIVMQLIAYNICFHYSLDMALNHAILTALLDRELTGYELAKEFDVSLGFFWQASHQQIYKQLGVLASDGFLKVTDVPQAGKPDKKLYGITDQGRSLLESWVSDETRRKPARDDLFVKLYNLEQANAEVLETQVTDRLQEHRGRLSLYEKIRDRGYRQPSVLGGRRLGMYLALRAGMLQEQASIDWCLEAIAYLRRFTPEN